MGRGEREGGKEGREGGREGIGAESCFRLRQSHLQLGGHTHDTVQTNYRHMIVT